MENKKLIDYPKVLIIGQSFDDRTGGGITLSNLFHGWPKENLAIATYQAKNIEKQMCSNYYYIGSNEKKFYFPISLLFKLDVSRIINLKKESQKTLAIKSNYLKKKSKKQSIIKAIKRIIENSGLISLFNKIQLSEQFKEWINQFSPDLIYTQLGSIWMNDLILSVVSELNIPYVIHFMDDWPIKFSKIGFFSILLRKSIENKLRKIIINAAQVMTICQRMSDEYEIRYHRKSVFFHNPVDIVDWQKYIKTNWDKKEQFRILFTGKLGKKSEALFEVAEVIKILKENKMNIFFDIYTIDYESSEAKRLEKYGNVIIHKPVSHDKIPELLSTSDLLLLPLSFEPDYVIATRLSMPTKTSEYLISGVPILVYAHSETALNRYAKNDKWAYIVYNNDLKSLRNAIEELYNNINLRKQIGTNAINIAKKNHDAKIVRDKFRTVLLEAANKRTKCEE